MGAMATSEPIGYEFRQRVAAGEFVLAGYDTDGTPLYVSRESTERPFALAPPGLSKNLHHIIRTKTYQHGKV